MKKTETGDDHTDILAAAKCREIVTEILDFGINQNQIKILIKLLSYELEDRELMMSIANLLRLGQN